MAELVGVIDTSVLCCWLEVPGKETAGTGAQRWDVGIARTRIAQIVERSGTLILPMSVTIETANHIAQSGNSRYEKATELYERITSSLSGLHPWKSFDETQRLWTRDWHEVAQREWPQYAARRIGLADYSIAAISRYFHELGSEVITLTADGALAAEVGHLVPTARTRRRPAK